MQGFNHQVGKSTVGAGEERVGAEEEYPSSMRNGSHHAVDEKQQLEKKRGAVDYAFQADNQTTGRLGVLQEKARRSIHVWNKELSPDLSAIIREQTHYVIPAHNEGNNIHTVLGYLREQHRVPGERITVIDNSNWPGDRTPEVAKQFSVELVQQEQVLKNLLETDKFLDLLQSEKIPLGKGLTLFTAWLHLLASGKLNSQNLHDTHVVCLDADPQDYSVNKYDPLTNFAKLRRDFTAETIKPAKSNRNNQPIYTGDNALGIMGTHAREYLDYVGHEQWRLTGEMSRTSRAIPSLVMSTGYPVETTMNQSDFELGLRFMQYADGPERSDGHNPLEKETAMYTQILRSRLAIELWNHTNLTQQFLRQTPEASVQESLKGILAGEYKKSIDYTADDVRGVNSILAQDIFTYIPDETNRVPKGVSIKDIMESRLIGPVAMLVRERFVREIKLPQ